MQDIKSVSNIPMSTYLRQNLDIIKNKNVLDLACNNGLSTSHILNLGAKHVFAVDIRSHLIEQAKQRITHSNIDFVVGDVTDKDLISPLVKQSDTVIVLGLLYHLHNHFQFFSQILNPNVSHCLMETVFGPESLNPEMVWSFESVHVDTNGAFGNCNIVPIGTPNISWILQVAQIFGFACDYVQCHGNPSPKELRHITYEEYINVQGDDWPTYEDIISEKNVPDFVRQELSDSLYSFGETNKRVIIRLYNKSKVNSVPLKIQDIYKWPY